MRNLIEIKTNYMILKFKIKNRFLFTFLKISTSFLTLNLFLLFLSTSVSGQIILDNKFECILSEIPGRGHGLTNGVLTFYIDAKSRDLYTSQLESDFLLDFKKTKDNLYYSTGKKGDLFFYTIVIPESLYVISLTSNVNNSVFSQYSVALLSEVRKKRNSESQIYFIRKDRKECTF